MTETRLLIVTPRYWPLCGDTERATARWADELRRQGTRVGVVTAAWGGDWPRYFVHREVPVVRLPCAPLGGWRTLRYLRALSRWLRQHREAFDAVHVANLRLEAYTSLRAFAGSRVAIVLSDDDDDVAWHQRARLGRRVQRICQAADAIVASTEATADRLRDAGFPPANIELIPRGVSPAPRKTAALRLRARQALAAINHDLAAPDYAPVVVWVGRLDEQAGLLRLIEAWRAVVERWPSARLWLIGDGPAREELYEWIVALGRHHDIFLPGSFDELEDVFLAADLYVALRQELGGTIAQLEALACGLPMVLGDTPGNRAIMRDFPVGWIVPLDDPVGLAAAICQALDEPERARAAAGAARVSAQSTFSVAQAASRYLSLIERIQEGKQQSGR